MSVVTEILEKSFRILKERPSIEDGIEKDIRINQHPHLRSSLSLRYDS